MKKQVYPLSRIGEKYVDKKTDYIWEVTDIIFQDGRQIPVIYNKENGQGGWFLGENLLKLY